MLLKCPVDLADVWHAAAAQQNRQLRFLPDCCCLSLGELLQGVDLENDEHAMALPACKDDGIGPARHACLAAHSGAHPN
jgi:hypothetical protein